MFAFVEAPFQLDAHVGNSVFPRFDSSLTSAEDHLKGCEANAIRNRDHEPELITEVVDIFNKFSKQENAA
jgi:hypothetical protein